MLTRLAVLAALAGAFFTLSQVPARADTASDIAALKSAVAALQSNVSSLQSTVASQATTIHNQQSIIAFFSKKTDATRADHKEGTELFITGCNVHLVNGLGATNGEPNTPTDYNSTAVNGLGNLIIGYNLSRGSGKDVRTGSHNLIVGDAQNYSRYGGVLFGEGNAISGAYACITGGANSVATGYLSSISGGDTNAVSGNGASISGGYGGVAEGYASSITGGRSNTASGDYSSIGGGQTNAARGAASSVSGGEYNATDGDWSCVGGGNRSYASGRWASVSGGYNHTASGDYDWAAGSLFEDY